ncbi:MAG: flagellar basal body-associated FliL family protein [Rhodospirillales bacterium]
MADDDLTEEDGAAADGGAGDDIDLEGDDDEDGKGGGKKKGSKLKLIIIAVVALLVIGGGGFGAMMVLGGDGEDDSKPSAEMAIPVYHELPEMLVDLKTGRCRSPYLKITIVMTVRGQEGVARAREVEPLLMDTIQSHLRDTEREELLGKAGADQLRADILTIAGSAMAPAKVEGVLFKQFLLQ